MAAPLYRDPDPTRVPSAEETVRRETAPTPAPPPESAVADAPDFGRYRLLGELGRGGMGVVWKAWDTALERVVALKVIWTEGERDPMPAERFAREARITARLKHPNIVSLHDVGVHEGQPYYTAEFVDGRPLSALIQEPVPPRRAAEWAQGIAEALAYAHAQGVVHRDVKPANVLIDLEGRPRVTDFGLAKEVALDPEATARRATLTASGSLVGTPQYMSPEQAGGHPSRIGPASDQFSLGAVLYEMLAGRPPFAGLTLRDLLNAIAEREPDRPTRFVGRIHRDLETICLRALEKDPRRRYPSTGEMAADLGRFLSGEPILARRLSWLGRMWRAVERHPVAALAVLAVVLVAGIGGVWGLVASMRKAGDLREALAQARGRQSRGSAPEAREAFQRAMRIDPSSEEAAAGVAWANREAEAAAARASERLALESAGHVADVLLRFGALATTIEKMEASFHDERLADEEREKAAVVLWPEIERFMRDTPADDASASTMMALAGWARRLSGHGEEGVKWMREATATAPDLPFGWLVEAMVSFSAYVELQQNAGFEVDASGIRFGPPPQETAAMTVFRKEAERCLEAGARARVWGTGISEDVRAAMDGMKALQEGKYEEAETGFTRALASGRLVFFRREFLLARGKIRFVIKRYAEGISDLEEVLRARPGQDSARCCLAELRFGLGALELSRGEDGREDLNRALALVEEALAWRGESALLCNSRVMIGLAKGLTEDKLGLDSRATLRGAVEAATQALVIAPDDSEIRANRVTALNALAELEQRAGADPRPSWRRALEDTSVLLAAGGDALHLLTLRASTWRRLAEADAAVAEPTGEDRRGELEAADALMRIPLAADDVRAAAHAWRGDALEGLGRPAEAATAYEEALRLEPGDADVGAALERARRAAGPR